MIDKAEFMEKIKQQFMEVDDINVDENTDFRQFDEWDSLTGMAIQVMVTDDYGVDLTIDVFKSLNTVGEIYDFVNENTKVHG